MTYIANKYLLGCQAILNVAELTAILATDCPVWQCIIATHKSSDAAANNLPSYEKEIVLTGHSKWAKVLTQAS